MTCTSARSAKRFRKTRSIKIVNDEVLPGNQHPEDGWTPLVMSIRESGTKNHGQGQPVIANRFTA